PSALLRSHRKKWRVQALTPLTDARAAVVELPSTPPAIELRPAGVVLQFSTDTDRATLTRQLQDALALLARRREKILAEGFLSAQSGSAVAAAGATTSSAPAASSTTAPPATSPSSA